MRIFVSYTKHNDDLKPDLELSTQAIKDKLSLLGDVFMDYPLHEPSRVWDELDRCDVFVLIKSDKNSKSKWMVEERKRAEVNFKIIVELSYFELLNIKDEDLTKMIRNSNSKSNLQIQSK